MGFLGILRAERIRGRRARMVRRMRRKKESWVRRDRVKSRERIGNLLSYTLGLSESSHIINSTFYVTVTKV